MCLGVTEITYYTVVIVYNCAIISLSDAYMLFLDFQLVFS